MTCRAGRANFSFLISDGVPIVHKDVAPDGRPLVFKLAIEFFEVTHGFFVPAMDGVTDWSSLGGGGEREKRRSVAGPTKRLQAGGALPIKRAFARKNQREAAGLDGSAARPDVDRTVDPSLAPAGHGGRARLMDFGLSPESRCPAPAHPRLRERGRAAGRGRPVELGRAREHPPRPARRRCAPRPRPRGCGRRRRRRSSGGMGLSRLGMAVMLPGDQPLDLRAGRLQLPPRRTTAT